MRFSTFMFLTDVISRIRFWRNADRIGPDILWTHWRLYFPGAMRTLCQKKFQYFHPTAELRPGSYCIACSKIRIGRNVLIRSGSFFMADPRKGEHGITIEDDVLLGPGVHIYVNNHTFNDPARPVIEQDTDSSKPVIIRRGSWIGAGAIILAGVEVGENSVIGAGCVVFKSVPPHSVVASPPMRILTRQAIQ